MRATEFRLFTATLVVLAVVINEARANAKDELWGEIEKDFENFAAAVKADKFDEFARWIVPPADKVWAEFRELRKAIAKYDAALDQKFGKDKELILNQFMGHDSEEANLKAEAANWSKAAGIFRAQTDEVNKGTYSTRKEALKGLRKATDAEGVR